MDEEEVPGMRRYSADIGGGDITTSADVLHRHTEVPPIGVGLHEEHHPMSWSRVPAGRGCPK